MATIQLTQGKVAAVPDDLFRELNKFKWRAYKHGRTFYAARNVTRDNGRRTTELMHRRILELRGYDLIDKEVDHCSGDGLNNLDCNLRVATRAENTRNRRTSRDNSSGFKGVSRHEQAGKWQVHIRVGRKRVYLGLYHLALTAALIYDAAARRYFGEFATLNFPRQGERAASTGNVAWT